MSSVDVKVENKLAGVSNTRDLRLESESWSVETSRSLDMPIEGRGYLASGDAVKRELAQVFFFSPHLSWWVDEFEAEAYWLREV